MAALNFATDLSGARISPTVYKLKLVPKSSQDHGLNRQFVLRDYVNFIPIHETEVESMRVN